MSPDPGPWRPRFSEHYTEQLGDRRYRSRIAEIERRLAVLLRDPYNAANAERLKHQYSGLRSARLFDATRLIYRLCEECRKLGEQDQLPLDCCLLSHTAALTVNILCLSEHYADMRGEFDFDE